MSTTSNPLYIIFLILRPVFLRNPFSEPVALRLMILKATVYRNGNNSSTSKLGSNRLISVLKLLCNSGGQKSLHSTGCIEYTSVLDFCYAYIIVLCKSLSKKLKGPTDM
jgi:hypothetical protein